MGNFVTTYEGICRKCKGYGYIEYYDIFWEEYEYKKCKRCKGTGIRKSFRFNNNVK